MANELPMRSAAERRRFFLDRGLRRRRHGTGSGRALESLMRLPRVELRVHPDELFAGIPYCVVGGVATRAYMPERMTKDVAVLVAASDFSIAEQRLRDRGYVKTSSGENPCFRDSSNGLFGTHWEKGSTRVDVISSHGDWVDEALTHESRDQTGLRVIALPYLVLMKLDASRGQDQADVERMLGRLAPGEVERVAATVAQYLDDPEVADDVRQYAALGQLEYRDSSEKIDLSRRLVPPPDL